MRTAQSLAVGALWLAAGFLLGWSGAAQATNWARPAVSGAGDWNNENNWSPVRVPGRDASNDEGWVNNGGTCDVTANPLYPFRQLHVINASTLNVQTGATIGWSDFGEVNSGGVINTYGTAVMSGVMVVQGTGVFNQWGGTVQVNGLGGGGTYNLKNGTAATPLFGALTMANGNNTFNHDNGTMSVDRVVALGYGTGASSYNLNGGVFNQIYGDRPFQVGGWNYDGGGFGGTGVFTQIGGTANIAAEIYLGLRGGSGTYSLSNGTLNSTSMHIGDVPSGGTGIFNLSGGSISLTGGISFNTDAGDQFNWTGGTLKAASFTPQAGGQLLQTSTAASSILDVTANSMTVSGDYTIQGSGSSASIGVGRILSVTGTVSLRDGAAINGPGALAAPTIDARSGSISAPIGGAAALTKSSAGTVILTGSNSYAGGTNVTGGILQGNSASLAGNVTLSNNAGLVFDQASDGSFNGVIGGNGSVTKQSAGTLTVTKAQNYTGPTEIRGGTLQLVSVSLPSGAVGYYSFDNISGPSTVVNGGSAGSVKNGTLNGAGIVSGGIMGNAMSVSGSQYMGVNLTANKGIDLSGGSWTASGWFNGLYGTGQWRTLFRGNSNDHQIIVEDSSTRLGLYDNSNGAFRPSGFNMSTLTAGWHQVTAVGSGTTTAMYIDGLLVGSCDRKSVTDIYAVGNYQGGGQAFAQKIDEVYIYQRVLDSSEVSALYSASQGLSSGGSDLLPTTTAVSIASGATLDLTNVNQTLAGISGKGSVIGTGVLTVTGAVSPGDLSGAGALTMRNLTLLGGSSLNFDLSALLAANDKVVVTDGNALAINGPVTVNLNNLGGLENGTYVLLDYAGAPLGGTPFGYLGIGAAPSGTPFSYTLVNDLANTSVDLLVEFIPEPATLSLLALGGLALLLRRRRN